MTSRNIRKSNPYRLLIIGLLVCLAYPVSVVLGRRNSSESPLDNLSSSGYISSSWKSGEFPDGTPSGIYTETSSRMQVSKIWRISVANPQIKQELAAVQHAVGHPPSVQVCPAQGALALTVVPPGSSEYNARIQGGDLWWLKPNASGPTFLSTRVGSAPYPAPDCQSILFSRLVPLQQPRSQHIPFRTEFILMDTRNNQERIVLSDELNYGLNLLGWHPQGSIFYYMTVNLQGDYSVHALQVSDSRILSSWQMTGYSLVRSPTLSPTGGELVFEGIRKDEEGIYSLPLTNTNPLSPDIKTILRLPSSQNPPPNKAVWSGDGRQAWVPASPGAASQAESFLWLPSTQSRARVNGAVLINPSKWIPAALSNNGRWRVWQENQAEHPGLRIHDSEVDIWIDIPRQDLTSYLIWSGWLGD